MKIEPEIINRADIASSSLLGIVSLLGIFAGVPAILPSIVAAQPPDYILEGTITKGLVEIPTLSHIGLIILTAFLFVLGVWIFKAKLKTTPTSSGSGQFFRTFLFLPLAVTAALWIVPNSQALHKERTGSALGAPIPDAMVIVTNIATDDQIVATTNENGFYSVNLSDNGWEPPAMIQVTLDDAVTPVFEPRINLDFVEDVIRYMANMNLPEELNPVFPSDPSVLTTTPYLGYVYVFRTSAGDKGCTYDCSNMDYFSRTATDGYTRPWFDLEFDDQRTSTESCRERHYVETYQKIGGSTARQEGPWDNYTPPHNVQDTQVVSKIVSGTYRNWYEFASKGGYDAEPDSHGSDGNDHWVWITP